MQKLIIDAPVEGCFECGSKNVRTVSVSEGESYTYVCTDNPIEGDEYSLYYNKDGSPGYHNRGGWWHFDKSGSKNVCTKEMEEESYTYVCTNDGVDGSILTRKEVKKIV